MCTQGGGDFDLLAGELELHGSPPLVQAAVGRRGQHAGGLAARRSLIPMGAFWPVPSPPVQPARWRSLELGMRRASRYLATVRRATWMPLRLSSSASAWSDSGLRVSSTSMSFLIMAWMAVAEAPPPSSVETPLEKKYFSS